MELIASQSGFKYCAEPLNLRRQEVRAILGMSTWSELYDIDSEGAILNYLAGFAEGELSFNNPAPFRKNYRPLTHRMVFKLLHGAEHLVPRLKATLNAGVILLIRHPIATAISREVYPRLDAYIESDYKRLFSERELALARKIIVSGSKLERGVLSWCMQTAVPLLRHASSATVITYEQLVDQPEPVIRRLAKELKLPDPARLVKKLPNPSQTTVKSDAQKRALISQLKGENDTRRIRQEILSSWRKKISRRDEVRAMEIVRIFGIDAYVEGQDLPKDELLIE